MINNSKSVRTPLPLRFNDLDMAGHVHNSEYLNYFEIGRIDFFNKIIDSTWDWKKKGILVARNEVDYVLPIYFQDQLIIETFYEETGKKSITLGYRIIREREGVHELCSKGRSILVCFDFQLNTSVEVFPEWRAKLEM